MGLHPLQRLPSAARLTGQDPCLGRRPAPAGQRQELPGRAPGGGEYVLIPPVQPVAGEGHRHGARLLHQLLQHAPLLGGEVGEAVQVDVPPLRPAALRQRRRQPGEPVPGIGPLPEGQRLIGPADKGQVGKLVPGLSPGLPGHFPQLFRGNSAGLALVHRGGQPGEELGLPGGAGVYLQLVGHRLEGHVHQQQPPARVQGRGGQSARHGKDPAGKPGEGEHLRVQTHGVASLCAQPALHIVGVLLRNNEQLGPPP